jgi:hypothetical protein
MSVDFAATVTVSFSVQALLEEAGATVATLLGVPVAPAPTVLLGRQRDQGRVSSPGRAPYPGELDVLFLGPRADRVSAASGAPVLDIVDGDGNDLVVPFESGSATGEWRLILTPRRDPVGIVWGMASALAAARLGHGRFIDDDLRLTDPPLGDPDAFVAAVRRSPSGGAYPDVTREFLGQFDGVRDWLGLP